MGLISRMIFDLKRDIGLLKDPNIGSYWVAKPVNPFSGRGVRIKSIKDGWVAAEYFSYKHEIKDDGDLVLVLEIDPVKGWGMVTLDMYTLLTEYKQIHIDARTQVKNRERHEC